MEELINIFLNASTGHVTTGCKMPGYGRADFSANRPGIRMKRLCNRYKYGISSRILVTVMLVSAQSLSQFFGVIKFFADP